MNKQEWQKHLVSVRSIARPPITHEQEQIGALADALRKAVQCDEPFGLLLSGGVDSSLLALLCKQKKLQFTCYTVGIESSPDIEAAQHAAAALDLKLKQRAFHVEELESLFRKTAAIVPPDVISLGVGAVEIAAVELALADGTKVLMGGLGSEEIFAGYERHAQAIDVNAECWRGLENMYDRDMIRDKAIATHFGVRFTTPFLDRELMAVAMRIPGNVKITDGQKKVILRKTAEALGLPKEIAWRKKQAAQYGSKFDAVLEKLAKRAGMGKQEYVVSLKQAVPASPRD